MAKVPVRFQRIMAAAFDADVELSRRVKRCSESSGSEHSPESSNELSDLVLSFMEENERGDEVGVVLCDEDHEIEAENERFDDEKKEMLQKLFAGDEDDENDAKEAIRREVELDLASGVFENRSIPGFKRTLMSRLREKGFDAGLCKTKWEKNGNLTAGNYEYIDVNFNGKRYIVEVSLAAEFEIARPTNQFASLLEVFPTIFVGKVEDLKRIVRLMCTAIKGSMKKNELHTPPWRRNAYMQARWFSSYKRTTNAIATGNGNALGVSPLFPKRSVGFEALPVKGYNCRDVYVANSNTGIRIGHLAAAFNSDNFGLQL